MAQKLASYFQNASLQRLALDELANDSSVITAERSLLAIGEGLRNYQG